MKTIGNGENYQKNAEPYYQVIHKLCVECSLCQTQVRTFCFRSTFKSIRFILNYHKLLLSYIKQNVFLRLKKSTLINIHFSIYHPYFRDEYKLILLIANITFPRPCRRNPTRGIRSAKSVNVFIRKFPQY